MMVVKKKPDETVSNIPQGAWEPLGDRVIVKLDKRRSESKGGIVLPDNCKIPQLTGIVVAIPESYDPDQFEQRHNAIRPLDKVLMSYDSCCPIDVEVARRSDLNGSNVDLYVVNIEDILAVFRPEGRYAC